ncbi:MAG: PHP domain-containing protein [Deltaproteobacteria bacterium]|nr:PHP domain-containing protein [Deltaproteobacteria bacterium]
MLIDMHVHSNLSPDASLAIEVIVSRVKQIGLDGFCLTDVHSVAGAAEARRLAAEAGLLALVGFEAFCDRGHFLVFVPEPERLPEIRNWVRFDEQGRMNYESLLQGVRARRGVIVAAHPFDREKAGPGDAVAFLEGIDAIEVANGRRARLANELAEEMAAGIGLPGVGGSDARNDPDEMGQVASLVLEPLGNEADLVERIRACDVWPVRIGEPEKEREPSRRKRGARGDRARSRAGERSGSRAGSRSGSRSGSRAGSRSGGRAGDRSGGRAGDRSGGRAGDRSGGRAGEGPGADRARPASGDGRKPRRRRRKKTTPGEKKD